MFDSSWCGCGFLIFILSLFYKIILFSVLCVSVFLLLALVYCYHYNMFYFVGQPFCLFVFCTLVLFMIFLLFVCFNLWNYTLFSYSWHFSSFSFPFFFFLIYCLWHCFPFYLKYLTKNRRVVWNSSDRKNRWQSGYTTVDEILLILLIS